MNGSAADTSISPSSLLGFELLPPEPSEPMSDSSGLPFVIRRPQRRTFARKWKALPRLQRTLICGALLISCFLAGVAFVYLPRGSAQEPQHRKEPQTSRLITAKTATTTVPAVSDEKPKVDAKADEQAAQIDKPTRIEFTGAQNERQKAVVEAFRHAWTNYKKYAWGRDHLKPLARTGHDWFGLGLTIVDSLDTLLIMNLREEFGEAREWVAKELDVEKPQFVNFFETTIRVLGGLLSAFHLSGGDTVFLTKAKDLGGRLLGAFGPPSLIPFADVNLKTRKPKQPSWGADSSLSEVATVQLEFRELSRLSGNPTYERIAMNVSQHIHRLSCSKLDGLCPMFINPKTGQWHEKVGAVTMGARADSYYEYLLKQWLQTGKTVDWLRADYVQAMSGMQRHLWRKSEPGKLGFVGELVGDKSFSPKMDHLVCFLAGTLALGAANGLPPEHMDLAKDLANTCWRMYEATATGLGPEIVYFNLLPGAAADISIKPLDAHSLLRPEAIEAWFYLYRLTGDKVYQEWGWRVFEAIEKHARLPTGYASVQNAKRIPVTHRDSMESFFLGETLKYLYLLFADDQRILPLDQFVFNTEAHPLPIHTN